MPFTLKPIVARQALTSTYGSNIAINPYQGCVFACEFCSAIKMNFFTGRTKEKWDKTGWGTWVDYKTNLVELLHKEKEKIKKSKIYFGNATDIYMPIERKLGLIPPILEFFLENPPIELEVQTRGTARDIARDIPLLQELSKKTSVLVSYSIHTDREDVRKIFEPKAPSLLERERGLRLYNEAGIETRLSCMPILPLNPEIYAERFAPFVTKRVWIATMNHKQLTKDLFQKHFPEWLDESFVEAMMQKTREEFEKRGVKSFYNSITPEAKKERWEWREKKIVERKLKPIAVITDTNQLNLF
ncbi:radical SAM protein [Emticicia sp.]|uniref:SPL family radical SAM protein n=1 Tax=Emticicia sp. TaxID=1930953 RepID=UPI003750BBF1